MAHPFHHALSSAKKWGGLPRIISSCINRWTSQKPRMRTSVTARFSTIHYGIFMLEHHFGPYSHELSRPHRSCPIHRRTTCDRRFGPDSNICRLDPLHPPRTVDGPHAAGSSRGRSLRAHPCVRRIMTMFATYLRLHLPVDANWRAVVRAAAIAISATRTPRRLQTASKARLLPNNARASRQRSVSRARVSPLTPPSARLFNPKEPGPAPGSLLFGDTQWLTITHQPSSNKLFLMPT